MTNLSNNSNINKNNKSLKSIIANIRNLFFQKYYINEFEYGRKVINEIMFNEPSHIVALFKDFLIIDDYSEFLKCLYKKNESLNILPNLCLYYETYSRIYPNYTPLKESIYIYKNIFKKQKMIDLQMEMDYIIQKKNLNNYIKNSLDESKNKKLDNQVFSTDIYNSIVNNSDNKEDLYFLFGIDQFNNNNNSIEEIKKIIKNIRKNDFNDCLKDCSKSIISDNSLLITNQNKNNNIDHRNNRRDDNNNNKKNNNKNNQKSNKIFNDLTKQLFSIKCEKFSQTTNLSKNNSQIKISTNQSLINNSISNLNNNNKVFKKNKILNNALLYDLKIINKIKNKKEKTKHKFNNKHNNNSINQFIKHHNSISSNKKKIFYIKNQIFEPSLKNLFIKKIYPYTQRNENKNNNSVNKNNKSNSNKKNKKNIRNKTNSSIKISPFSNKNNYNNNSNYLKLDGIKKYSKIIKNNKKNNIQLLFKKKNKFKKFFSKNY